MKQMTGRQGKNKTEVSWYRQRNKQREPDTYINDSETCHNDTQNRMSFLIPFALNLWHSTQSSFPCSLTLIACNTTPRTCKLKMTQMIQALTSTTLNNNIVTWNNTTQHCHFDKNESVFMEICPQVKINISKTTHCHTQRQLVLSICIIKQTQKLKDLCEETLVTLTAKESTQLLLSTPLPPSVSFFRAHTNILNTILLATNKN